MILSKRTKQSGVTEYTVGRVVPPEKVESLNGTYVRSHDIRLVIDHDADVYTEEGTLLLRFRKGVLPTKHIHDAYDAIIGFARNTTGARGATSGSKIKDVHVNKRIASNIMGYFDQWTLLQKHMFKTLGVPSPPVPVRATRFTADYPDQWERIVPLVQDIDRLYKRLVPVKYKTQRAKADETAFTIPKTAFSTITTNLNLVTAIHKDKGNLVDSFGNLVVIAKGRYSGGYTCYPEYGIGVDVRTGDFLAMDVHRFHGNVPMKHKSKDAERLSIVCYLRQGVWAKTRGTTIKDVEHSMATVKRICKDFYESKRKSDDTNAR